MKNVLFSLIIITCVSCKQKADIETTKDEAVPIHTTLDLKSLETNYLNWWTYHETNISLASDFIALNEQSEKITKAEFLKTLTTGDYIPLNLDSSEIVNRYKLYKLSKSANKNIRSTIKNTSQVSYDYYSLEGTSFPDFEFTDLSGTLYNNNTVKNKTLILKCWFINCKPCIAEFPELNELVEKNSHSEDFLFISLALDSESELKTFLTKKQFKYNVVPEQEEFISKKLEVTMFPTHFVIDENGIITKVVNKSTELISYLENKKLIVDEKLKNIPPPPPPM